LLRILILIAVLFLAGCQETTWECYTWDKEQNLIGYEKLTHRKCNVDSNTAVLSAEFPSGAKLNAKKIIVFSDPNAMGWLSDAIESYNGTSVIKAATTP